MESAEAKARRTEANCYISRLPYHIIKLIFCKLPLFSLTHSCRYVCKLWQQILMDPDFVRFHRVMRNPTDLFLCVDGRSLYWLEFQGGSYYFNLAANLDYCKSVQFLNSSNGLVCVCQDSKVLHVMNPITCEYSSLPLCEEGMSLFIPFCGVGLDPKTQKFKVLRCIYPPKELNIVFRFEVCTLGNGTWRSIVNFPRFVGFRGNSCNGAFVNGSLNFLAPLQEGKRICAFDFVSEQFKSMFLPPVFYDDDYMYRWPNVGVIRGSIYISCFVEGRTSHMDVWVMEEYGIVESWTKMLVIDFLLLGSFSLPICPIEFMLFENGDGLLHRPPNLFLCNPETTFPTRLETQGIQLTSCPFIVHSPSFASLKDVVGDCSKVLTARARQSSTVKDMNYTF